MEHLLPKRVIVPPLHFCRVRAEQEPSPPSSQTNRNLKLRYKGELEEIFPDLKIILLIFSSEIERFPSASFFFCLVDVDIFLCYNMSVLLKIKKKGGLEMRKGIVFSTVIVLIILIVASYCFTEDKYFKGYGIETWTKGDTLTIKTGDTQFSVQVLPKELSSEQDLALNAWRDILNVRIEKKDEDDVREEILLHVEVLAAYLKLGRTDYKHVCLDEKDLKKALLLLNQIAPIVADRFCGNWDDYCSIAELNKLINYPETSFQVGIVKEMTNNLRYFMKRLY